MLAVMLPLVTGLLVAAAFFWSLRQRGGGNVLWFELGLVYAAVVTLYLAYPLVGFVVLKGAYTEFNDARLSIVPPAASDVAAVGWLYTWHLVGFTAMYLAVRGRLPQIRMHLRSPRFYTTVALVLAYLLVGAFQVAVGLVYDTTASSYLESYLVWGRLPLLVAQVLNHVGGMKYPLSLALLAVLFAHYRDTRLLIALWLLAAIVVSAARLGSRTEVALLVFAAAAMYHALVRPIPPRFVAGGVVGGLAAFVAFGAIRGGVTVFNPFAASTEFEVLFGNAVHLHRLSAAGEHFPVGLFVADAAALVPQQLLPFTKIDPAAWYVATYFPVYAKMGGGLAFGTIGEAVLTGGWVSALTRGAALGLCGASIHRAYVRRCGSFWAFVLYVWVASLAYQCFRNTTFSLGVLFVYRFVPAVIVVTLLAVVLGAIAGARPLTDGGRAELASGA